MFTNWVSLYDKLQFTCGVGSAESIVYVAISDMMP